MILIIKIVLDFFQIKIDIILNFFLILNYLCLLILFFHLLGIFMNNIKVFIFFIYLIILYCCGGIFYFVA